MDIEKSITCKALEKEARLFGLPLNDFYMVVLYFLGYLALPIFVKPILGIDLGVTYYSLGFVLLVVIMKIMQRYAKKKYPKYLFSIISYRYMQPKAIQVKKDKV